MGESPKPPRKRRWLRRLLIVAVLGALLYGFRAPLLQTLAGFLVVTDADRPAEVVLLLDADRGQEPAARFLQSGQCSTVLVLEGPPSRLHRMGFLPPAEEVARRALAKAGIKDVRLEVIRCDRHGVRPLLHSLGAWLVQHPRLGVRVLCNRFTSRQWRCLFDEVLPEDCARRCQLIPVAHRRYDETNWWSQKEGVLDFFGAYMGYLYFKIHGDDSAEWREWDPDSYEKTLP